MQRKKTLAPKKTPIQEGGQFLPAHSRFPKKCSSKLYVMSVVEVMTDYEAFSPQKVEEAMEAGVRNHLEAVKTQARKEGVDCEAFITHGDPHQDIVDEAAKRKPMWRRSLKWQRRKASRLRV